MTTRGGSHYCANKEHCFRTNESHRYRCHNGYSLRQLFCSKCQLATVHAFDSAKNEWHCERFGCYTGFVHKSESEL